MPEFSCSKIRNKLTGFYKKYNPSLMLERHLDPGRRNHCESGYFTSAVTCLCDMFGFIGFVLSIACAA